MIEILLDTYLSHLQSAADSVPFTFLYSRGPWSAKSLSLSSPPSSFNDCNVNEQGVQIAREFLVTLAQLTLETRERSKRLIFFKIWHKNEIARVNVQLSNTNYAHPQKDRLYQFYNRTLRPFALLKA